MIADKLYQSIKNYFGHALVRGCVRWMSYTPIGGFLAAAVLSRVSGERRRAGAYYLMKFVTAPWPQRCLILCAWGLARLGGGERAVETYWLLVGFSARPDRAVKLLSSEASLKDAETYAQSSNLHIARAVANYDAGNFRKAAHHFAKAHELEPETLFVHSFGLNAAYANSQILDTQRAMANFGRFFHFVDVEKVLDDKAAQERFNAAFMERAVGPLVPRLVLDQSTGHKNRGYGVFFHSSTQALGHAILDPYYFLALRRKDYDRIYFLGPSRGAYHPASALCLRLIEQYGDYIEVADDALLNASWMHFGTLKEGPVELCVEHYWTLLREAVHRTLDAEDPFSHNAWHMTLPKSIESRGRRFVRHAKIDLDRPLVVLHARHSAYHGIGAQAFRDANIRNYVPAIRHLLSLGYQVVRIGDRAMPRLKIRHKHYLELPFDKRYRPEYDPFFIAQADFMIGCQSGPCAYARALGVPLLSVNAVLHYTLLPASMEMACCKRFQRKDGQRWVDISLEEALDADVQHFDNAYQFDAAGIRVGDAQAEEIVAAVNDMIDWLADPDKPMTAEQARFHAAAEAKCAELMARGPDLDKPIADFLGIALPGYRLSPTVAKMRESRDKPDAAANALQD